MTSPRNARTTARGRTYRWRDEEFTSVTTIINGGMPKPALVNWAAKSVAEFVAANLDEVTAVVRKDKAAAVDLMKGSPWRQRDAAAAQGSDIHHWAEAQVLGHPVPDLPPEQQPYFDAFLAFLKDWEPEFELSEATVYNRHYSYAGTLDAIAMVNGTRTLVDFKTGRGVYGDVALQLAAYANAEFIGMPSGDEVPMPPTDAAAVLHLTPKGYQLIPVEANEVAFRTFLYAQQVRAFCETTSKECLGAPLPAPVRAEVVA